MPKNAVMEAPPADIVVETQDIPHQTDVPDPSTVAARAYQLWIQRGCPDGSPDEDWFRAEQELTSGER